MYWIFLSLLLIALAVFIAHLFVASGFRKRADALIAGLRAASNEGTTALQVPAVIEAYVHRALPGSVVPKMVRLRQQGAMRLRAGGAWHTFTAEQTISVGVPAFVWFANVQVAPFISVRVLDAYVDGRGLLEARLFGSVPLARSSGPETDRGELMRYLAELVWAPHAMLYNPHLRWREIEDKVIEVSAKSTDGAAQVQLMFENGDITRVEADDRPRGEGNRTVPRRWAGRFFAYGERMGCRIPGEGEVSWVLDDGPFVYWRGTVTALEMA